MKSICRLITTCIFCICCLVSYSQNDMLTNADIIELKGAGFGDDVILSKIENSPGKYNVSTKGLVELKKNKVSEALIAAMIKVQGKQGKTAATTTSATSTTMQPASVTDKSQLAGLPRKTGIYLKTVSGEFHELEPAIYSTDKAGGIFAGLSQKQRASVRDSSANLVINDSIPVFYFYFGSGANDEGLAESILFTKAKSPNEFTVVKFEVVGNQNERLIVTAKGNFIDGASAGLDEKQVIAFKYKKIEQGLYEIYFPRALKKGQYAFMYAGSIKEYGTAGQRLYDFGIRY